MTIPDYRIRLVSMKKKRAKPGPKPKKPAERLSEIVTLRMTPADHKHLMRDAKAAGLSVSLYLQRCWKERG